MGTNLSLNLGTNTGIHEIWGRICPRIWGQIWGIPKFGEKFVPKSVLKKLGNIYVPAVQWNNLGLKIGHLSTLHEVSVQHGAIFQGLCCAAAEGRAYLQFVFLVYLQNLGTFTKTSNFIESTRISW